MSGWRDWNSIQSYLVKISLLFAVIRSVYLSLLWIMESSLDSPVNWALEISPRAREFMSFLATVSAWFMASYRLFLVAIILMRIILINNKNYDFLQTKNT